jgi:hypothetical protein
MYDVVFVKPLGVPSASALPDIGKKRSINFWRGVYTGTNSIAKQWSGD